METLSISVTGTSSLVWINFPEATAGLALDRPFLPLLLSSSSELLSLKPGGGAAIAGGGGCNFSTPPSASSSSSLPGGGRAIRSTVAASLEAQALEHCFPALPQPLPPAAVFSVLCLALQESQKYLELFWDCPIV